MCSKRMSQKLQVTARLTCAVNNPDGVLPVAPVPDVLDTGDARVVLVAEGVDAGEVGEVGDGECGQVGVGRGGHTRSCQHHDSQQVTHDAYQHDSRL